MSNQFITNKGTFLSEIINKILPSCDNAYFLVGYFYFSGFSELYEKLKDVHLRVLVGLEVEQTAINGIKEVDNFITSSKSRGQMREDYFKDFVNIYNNTDFFDSQKQVEAFKLFYYKIKEGTLEIRKTEDPNHAKMYLFENRDNDTICGTFPGTLITGSSNLSMAGLRNRMELNAILRGQEEYKEGKGIFDELWSSAIEIVDTNNLPDFNEKVIKKIWYEKLYSPYLMYIRVLKEYFDIPTKENILTPYDITEGTFVNLKYQTDAVQIALNSIENHNGVIVADVVGLGKSIIASTVARNLRLRTIVICPPHLLKQWEGYKDDFGFTATVYSSGQIEHALNFYREHMRSGEQYLIIVDEAHRYRNEYTQDYAYLHNLCLGNKVILLTATPFNNRPDDIYSILKLFQIPTKSTLKTVDNLGAAFKELIRAYKQLTEYQRQNKISDKQVIMESEQIAKSIRSIISPLVVRRSRIDLNEIPEYKKDLKKQHVGIVVPEDPQEQNYDLKEMRTLYLSTLNKISPIDKDTEIRNVDNTFKYFKAARYSPVTYVTDENKKAELAKVLEEKTGVKFNMLVGRQTNISIFMRKLLVRRFESSVCAFQKSLDSMIESSERILDWIKKSNKVPVYKKGNLPNVEDLYDFANDEDGEIKEEYEKYEERGFFEIDMQYINENFIKDIKSDLQLLFSIRNEWFGDENKIKKDPKLESFKSILRKQIKEDPDRKVVVFTEFADTANYIGDELKKAELPVFKYTSADSSINKKSEIEVNFDAGIKTSMQKDDYHILIATDAISEGYNLHRAGTIFNYDIPYNPTRVIQRIGRINRINKKVFDKLYIYNYFPTDVGEHETRTKEISTLKMAMIHAIMGEDTKALTKDEEVQSYFVERYKKEFAKSEEASWDNEYRRQLNELKGTDIYKAALEIPHRAKTGRKIYKSQEGVLIFGKKGNDFVFKISKTEHNVVSLTAEEALSLFKAEQIEQPFNVSKDFDKIYQNLKAHLFKNETKDRNEKERLNALAKIKLVSKSNILNKDYIKDLIQVIMSDALSGYELRYINKLMPKDYAKLSIGIKQDYLNRIISTCNKIDDGEESVILTEEIRK